MAAEQVTKGLTYKDAVRELDVKVTVYNTGFYIYHKAIIYSQRDLPKVDTTTRNTPKKVMDYITRYLRDNDVKLDDIIWKGNFKVIKDADGFNKTQL